MKIIYSYPDLSDYFKHTQGDYSLVFVHPNFDLQIKEIILVSKFEKKYCIFKKKFLKYVIIYEQRYLK